MSQPTGRGASGNANKRHSFEGLMGRASKENRQLMPEE
jgi:hypothetical protein